MTLTEEHKLKKDNAKRLTNSIKSIFRKIAKDIKLKYSRTGQLLDMTIYDPLFRSEIRKRSEIVANKFKNSQRSEMKKSLDQDIDEEILILIGLITEKNTNFITATNQNQQNELLATILTKLQEENVLINDEIVADELSKEFLKKGYARSEVIGDMVVNESAESSKQIEISNLVAIGLITDPIYEWRTILDGKERECHRNANGKRVKGSEPFEVCGEFLRFPTDTSLGATAKNVINCRCSKRLVV